MRHRKSGRRFNMPGAHRDSMLRNLAISLIEHELIKTTLPRAKELRRVAEPLITMAKEDSLAHRRLVFDRTRSRSTVGKLFDELGPRYQARPGRLHADPEVRLSTRRQRADGVCRARGSSGGVAERTEDDDKDDSRILTRAS